MGNEGRRNRQKVGRGLDGVGGKDCKVGVTSHRKGSSFSWKTGSGIWGGLLIPGPRRPGSGQATLPAKVLMSGLQSPRGPAKSPLLFHQSPPSVQVQSESLHLFKEASRELKVDSNSNSDFINSFSFCHHILDQQCLQD